MKIEKVNDHQIRCTLTKADLADRELKISELAYGTEKAKSLFRDMMQQAAYEFGFEAENIPLMIEAIPLNSECIVLIITKVEDPEELDTRFSKFAPSVHDSEEDSLDDISLDASEGADDILDLFKKIQENKLHSSAKSDEASEKRASINPLTNYEDAEISPSKEISKLFTFTHLNELIRLSYVLKNFYTGINSVYKDAQSGKFTLVITKSAHTPEEFNKICNIISEYGTPGRYSDAAVSYLEEHHELFISQKALQSLAMV